MKIAILTLPLHTNYGGILQCYALQTVLEGMGHQVTVLNRRWPESNGRLIIKMLSIFTKSILRKLLIGKKSIIVRNHRFSKAEEDG